MTKNKRSEHLDKETVETAEIIEKIDRVMHGHSVLLCGVALCQVLSAAIHALMEANPNTTQEASIDLVANTIRKNLASIKAGASKGRTQ